ncbi:hypothetical protein [Rhodoligotrophos appendicifer]|nr:hypothetical protein [Rhodoligotrophos appendicifer]
MSQDFTWATVVFEIAKLSIQAAVLVSVARLTVYWALNRYKREKNWEGQLKVYSDVIASLTALEEANNRRWEMEERHIDDPAKDADLFQVEQTARKTIDHSLPVARLLFSEKSFSILKKLKKKLDADSDSPNFVEILEDRSKILEEGIREIVKDARSSLK